MEKEHMLFWFRTELTTAGEIYKMSHCEYIESKCQDNTFYASDASFRKLLEECLSSSTVPGARSVRRVTDTQIKKNEGNKVSCLRSSPTCEVDCKWAAEKNLK